jgi:hypothetical protein
MPFDTEDRPPSGGYAASGSPPSSHSVGSVTVAVPLLTAIL